MEWAELTPRLTDEIIDILTSNNFLRPTPVQASTVPAFLSRKDVAVEAVTGSGKTLAFLVPIFHMLSTSDERLKGHQLGALVIEPVRELALQTYQTAKLFAEKLGFTISLLTGGSSSEELETSSGCANIVVGTPGRLASFLSKNDIQSSFKSLEVLVLDEADRLYSLGQAETVRSIISYLPKQRRTGLFSATLAESGDVMNEVGMRNPITIKMEPQNAGGAVAKIPEGLSIFYLKVQPSDKFSTLVTFLKSRPKQKHIVFFSTCAAVEYFSTVLRQLLGEQFPVLWIHGKIDKLSRREKIFQRFQSYSESGAVLVSTDLMSRGVDFPDVDWVVQFDPPSSPATFVHRCGRTARLNRIGSAVVFLLPNEIEYVRFIEKNQSISMAALKASEVGDVKSEAVLKDMRDLCVNDRDVFEKSSRAFVSFVQFYRKHECSLIFQLKELNIGQLAYSYGLLMMPRMPELRSFSEVAKSFKPMEGVNAKDIVYKDSGREKQRLEMLQKKSSTQKDQPSKKEMIRNKKFEQRKERLAAKMKEKKKKEKKAKRLAEDDSDWDELANDAKLIKRLKSGKMSEKQFERAMGLSSEEDN